jgi:hypothetical protein
MVHSRLHFCIKSSQISNKGSLGLMHLRLIKEDAMGGPCGTLGLCALTVPVPPTTLCWLTNQLSTTITRTNLKTTLVIADAFRYASGPHRKHCFQQSCCVTGLAEYALLLVPFAGHSIVKTGPSLHVSRSLLGKGCTCERTLEFPTGLWIPEVVNTI